MLLFKPSKLSKLPKLLVTAAAIPVLRTQRAVGLLLAARLLVAVGLLVAARRRTRRRSTPSSSPLSSLKSHS